MSATTSSGPASESGPDPQTRRDTQCQGCWKSQKELGMIFKRCDRCKIVTYCSRECQRAAWPSHKVHCNHNVDHVQNVKEIGDVTAHLNEELTKWTAKHQPLICNSIMDSLKETNRPDAHETDALVMVVIHIPGSPNLKTRFRVDAAEVVSYEVLFRHWRYEGLAATLRNWRLMGASRKPPGMLGSATGVVAFFGGGGEVLFCIIAVAFTEESLKNPHNNFWQFNLKSQTTDINDVFQTLGVSSQGKAIGCVNPWPKSVL